MKFNIENFDTMTSDDKILSDLTKNPELKTPLTDFNNEKNRVEINILLSSIKEKQKLISNLSKKINKEAIEITENINNEKNLSGKNIFFTNIPNLNIFESLVPVGLMTREQVVSNKIISIKNTDPPLLAPKNEWGFKTSMYELGINSQKTGLDTYIGIPLRAVGGAPPLLRAIESAAMTTYTAKEPNINYTFYYGLHNKNENMNIAKRIDNFNLSYTNLLPANLTNSNFLSVGYNGYIYVGTDVKKLKTDKKNEEGLHENFLDYLINNHSGGTEFGVKYGCVAGTKICGNQNIRDAAQEESQNFTNQANALDAVGGATLLTSMFNPLAFFEAGELFAEAGVDRVKSALALQNDATGPLKEFVWLSLLTNRTANRIIGPSHQDWATAQGRLSKDTNELETIQETFLVGGLKPVDYLGCYKDFPEPNRVLDQYGGVMTRDQCIQKASEEGYNLIGMQDGGPSGVGRRNYTNGQCWMSKKSLNEIPKCSDMAHQGGKDALEMGAKFLMGLNPATAALSGAIPNPSLQKPHGLCKVSDNDCQGNPKIGGPWRNAIYHNNNAPSFIPARLFLQGFQSNGVSAPPGSLVYTYPNLQGQIQTEILWKPNFPIEQSILIPFTPDKNQKLITEITNANSELEYLIGNASENKVLYSEDLMFKLVLDSYVDLSGKPKTGFMNSSNAFNFMKDFKESPMLKLINFNNTGIKVNLNTDFSQYNINSKQENISKLLTLIRTVDPGGNFKHDSGNFTIVYKLNSINNDLLGKVGFINYDNKKNSNQTPYNVSLYSNSQNNKSFKNGPSKFINTRGTIDKSQFPNGIIAPFDLELNNNISSTNVSGQSECERICFNNLEQCQAWQYTKNKCLTYNSNSNDVSRLLKAQAPITIFKPNLLNDNFNIRVPNIQNNSTCPDTIKDPLINAQTPSSTTNNINNSSVKWDRFHDALYWKVGEEIDNKAYCNVQKVINDDEIKLKKLEDELLVLINRFDNLINGLEKNEQKIFKNLLNEQIKTNKNTERVEEIKKKLDEESSNLDRQKTLNQSLDDSLFSLINTNYNFIIWTVLAITIVVAAIHFSRNIKKK